MGFAAAPAKTLRRVMVFIDGGHFRQGLKDLLGSDEANIPLLRDELARVVEWQEEHIRAQLIRVYYYDANVADQDTEKNAEKYREVNEYLSRIRQVDFYQVRLGRLIPTADGFRQKGVDVLLAIDMITKAYQDQYDIAVIFAGDDDLLDAVEAVKSAGKGVYGVYFERHISERLKQSFDVRIPFGTRNLSDVGRFVLSQGSPRPRPRSCRKRAQR